MPQVSGSVGAAGAAGVSRLALPRLAPVSAAVNGLASTSTFTQSDRRPVLAALGAAALAACTGVAEAVSIDQN